MTIGSRSRSTPRVRPRAPAPLPRSDASTPGAAPSSSRPPAPPPDTVDDGRGAGPLPGLGRFVAERLDHDPRLARSLVESVATGLAQLTPALRGPLAGLIDPQPDAGPVVATASMTPAQRRRAGRAGLDRIRRTLKAEASKLDAASIRASMLARYRALQLLDEDGGWRVPELAPYADVLLPTLGPAELRGFVDAMAHAAAKNGDLMDFLAAASRHEFPRLAAKVRAEGAEVLPDVLVYTQVLDRLTKVLGDDYEVSQACREHWKQFEAHPDFGKGLNVFQRVKLASVDAGIDKYNENHRTGALDPNTLAGILPLNIVEAELVDRYHAAFGPKETELGHRANAFAGHVLATHGPGAEGPATFSPDGKMVELHHPLTKRWDDLYATWNMGFVASVAGDFVYYLAKLVCPEVNDYADRPGEYINRRAIALKLRMTDLALQGIAGPPREIDWLDPELANLWGQVNAQSARRYAADVAAEAARRREAGAGPG